MRGLVPGARLVANVWMNGTSLQFGGCNEAELAQLEEAIVTGRATTVYIPVSNDIDETLLSRFIAKIALEVLAHRVISIEGWEADVIDKQELDEIRYFARVGDKPSSWPISQRRIYNEDDRQVEGSLPYQVLHEFTLLYTDLNELFAVVCIFGEEFTINLGGPEINGYTAWLKSNNGVSPLYLKDKLPRPYNRSFV